MTFKTLTSLHRGPFLPLPLVEQLPAATIGRSVENGKLITIGDNERRSGLYVLGRSGTGKTSLLTSLMAEDIRHGHGVFFLDPHGDGIENLKNCYDLGERVDSIRLFDPENEEYTFSINLLACSDVSRLSARTRTFDRAKGVFDKLWKGMFEEKPWLQKIIQHTLAVFIENQEYTLADLPLFFSSPVFREYLVSRVEHNIGARDFWKYDFASKGRREQELQLEAAQTRSEILLGQEHVMHIVGRRETTVDFAEIMDKRQIVLFKLPSTLSSDTQKIIGTIIVSELLHAVRARAGIAAEARHQFCIFVDEIHNFASSKDFATLINEARKFGIATTFAHQERFGQFGDNKEMLGATDAAVSKVFFQTTVKDAEYSASEFAREPPPEIKRERELVISQEPVAELMRGHTNPQIASFVKRRLRPLKERLEDIRSEMQEEQLLRSDFLDDSGLYRIQERMEYSRETRYEAAGSAQSALAAAKEQTAKLRALLEQSIYTRLSIRRFNRFLTDLMEGQIKPGGDERFSEFLIDRVEVRRRRGEYALKLYIELVYGNPNVAREIPFEFAKTRGLFAPTIKRIEEDTAQKRWRRQHEFLKKELYFYKTNTDDFQRHIRAWRVREWDKWMWPAHFLCVDYLFLRQYDELKALLGPYLRARFAPSWQCVIPNLPKLIEDKCNEVKTLCIDAETLRQTASLSWQDTAEVLVARYKKSYQKVGAFALPDHIDQLQSFLKRYGEGAFVVLSLLMVARINSIWKFTGWDRDYCTEYKSFNMLWLPAIEGREPLEILLLVKKLNEIMLGKDYQTHCLDYFHFYGKRARDLQHKDPGNCHPKWFAESLKWCFRVEVGDLTDSIWKRVDVRLLTREMGTWWNSLSKDFSATERAWWTGLDETARTYLIVRACDIAILGEETADRTWPEPTTAGAPRNLVARIVASLTGWMRAIAKDSFDAPLGEVYKEKLVPLPDYLAPRVLKDNEIEELKRLCQRELSQNATSAAMVKVVEEFVEFCTLLSKPENHIKTPTGQYIEREVPGRAYKDMADQMVQQLVKLPLYTAQAKLIKFDGGVQQSVLREIQTLKPPERLAEEVVRERTTRIEKNTMAYYVSRKQIKEEISLRQAKWRGRVVENAPQTARLALPPPAGMSGGMETDDAPRTHE